MATIGLVRPKDVHNLGGVLRAAHCFGARAVVIEGARFQRSAANTTKAERNIPIIRTDDVLLSTPAGAVPVAIEFVDDAQSLFDFEHPKNAFYIFGPEDGSLPKRQQINTVHIPTTFCLNLAATVNVVLYDRAAKLSARREGLAA